MSFSLCPFQVYKGYVDDPRNTDNAWMETVAVNFHDEAGNFHLRFFFCLSFFKSSCYHGCTLTLWMLLSSQATAWASCLCKPAMTQDRSSGWTWTRPSASTRATPTSWSWLPESGRPTGNQKKEKKSLLWLNNEAKQSLKSTCPFSEHDPLMGIFPPDLFMIFWDDNGKHKMHEPVSMTRSKTKEIKCRATLTVK